MFYFSIIIYYKITLRILLIIKNYSKSHFSVGGIVDSDDNL